MLQFRTLPPPDSPRRCWASKVSTVTRVWGQRWIPALNPRNLKRVSRPGCTVTDHIPPKACPPHCSCASWSSVGSPSPWREPLSPVTAATDHTCYFLFSSSHFQFPADFFWEGFLSVSRMAGVEGPSSCQALSGEPSASPCHPIVPATTLQGSADMETGQGSERQSEFPQSHSRGVLMSGFEPRLV